MGIVIGSISVFHAALLKPAAVRLRLALLAGYREKAMPPLPMPGLTLIDQPEAKLRAAIIDAGFVPLGDQFLRGDLTERIALALHRQRIDMPRFVPDRALATSIGIGERTYVAMLRAMGFVPAGQPVEGRWKWNGLQRRARNTPADSSIIRKHRS